MLDYRQSQYKFKKSRLEGISDSKIAFPTASLANEPLKTGNRGVRSPTGPARALLKIVDVDPEGAIRTLNS